MGYIKEGRIMSVSIEDLRSVAYFLEYKDLSSLYGWEDLKEEVFLEVPAVRRLVELQEELSQYEVMVLGILENKVSALYQQERVDL